MPTSIEKDFGLELKQQGIMSDFATVTASKPSRPVGKAEQHLAEATAANAESLTSLNALGSRAAAAAKCGDFNTINNIRGEFPLLTSEALADCVRTEISRCLSWRTWCKDRSTTRTLTFKT